MSVSFHEMLDQIRAISDSEREKGARFERVMKKFFAEDPLVQRALLECLALVRMGGPVIRGFDAQAIQASTLWPRNEKVAYCAVQCKCYAPDTRISKPHLDSFISASARDPFTARIVVDTGHPWGPTAKKTVARLKAQCRRALRFDRPDQSATFRLARLDPRGTGRLAPPARDVPIASASAAKQSTTLHERASSEHDRGKLIMACGTGKTFTALRIAEAVVGRWRPGALSRALDFVVRPVHA